VTNPGQSLDRCRSWRRARNADGDAGGVRSEGQFGQRSPPGDAGNNARRSHPPPQRSCAIRPRASLCR
jgi:hypothetical protein